MTKAQAIALMGQLEATQMNGSAVMRFSSTGVESWNVQLDPTIVYTLAQLSGLTGYCTSHNLTLTATFSALGIT